MPKDKRAEIIRVEGLCKFFGMMQVLKSIDLTVCYGETVVLLGASGSGKSTLLRCINFLEVPDAGRVFLDGTPVGVCDLKGTSTVRYTEVELQRLRTRVGMVFQQFNLFPHMTALQNVMAGQIAVLRRSKADAADRGRKLLDRVGLGEKANEYPSRLSGGQQQRVAIARALAMDPEVVLFDEVTSSLDPELVGEVLNVMQSLREEGVTMVIVTHELGFAYHVADRVAFLSSGTIYEEGRPDQVLCAPVGKFTQQFLARHTQFRLP